MPPEPNENENEDKGKKEDSSKDGGDNKDTSTENKEPPKKEEPPKPPPKEKKEEEPPKKEDPPQDSGLKAQLQASQAEVKKLQGAIKDFVSAALADLDEREHDLVEKLGGKDPLGQLNAYNALKEAGKLGSAGSSIPHNKPDADRERAGGSDTSGEKPDSWDEADRRLSRKLRAL